MNVADLLEGLFAQFPVQDAEAWDHVGLSVGDPASKVQGVACALDVTVGSIEAAVALGANVLLAHHPVYLSAPTCFSPGSSALPAAAASVYAAAQQGVSVISLHTNLDRSHEARDMLSGLMGFEPVASLEYPGDPASTGLGALCEIPPATLLELARRAEERFGTTAQVWGDATHEVRRLALLGGSLGDMGEQAISCGCDAVITGELGYHRAQDLMLRGLSVVLLGHDRSEQPFCRILADAAARAGVEHDRIHIIPLPRQWWGPTQGGHA